MQKKHLIAVLFVLLIMTSCKGGSGTQTPISELDIRKGFDGLSVELLKNAPPDKIFEDTPFPLIMRLQNKGARDVGNDNAFGGILSVGVERDYITMSEDSFRYLEDKVAMATDRQSVSFKIKGKSILSPRGEQELVEANLKTKRIGAQSESRKSNVLVTACYDYGTKLGTDICVDTDIYGLRPGQKACKAQDLNFANGQGAPVAITKIETRMLPDVDNNIVKPQFMIYIENKGNGEVIKPGSFPLVCSGQPLGFKEFNLLSVKGFLSEDELDCTPTRGTEVDEAADIAFNYIKLKDKKSVIRCTAKEGIDRNKDAYIAPLRVELDYGYTFTVSKEMTIEKALRY